MSESDVAGSGPHSGHADGVHDDWVATILDTIGDAFIAVDSAWRFVIVNQRAATMLGHPAEYLLGRRMDQEFPDVAAWPYYRQAMEEREPVCFESYSELTRMWVEVHAYPALDGISMIITDITERTEAQLALAEARQRLDAHIDNSPLAIIEFDEHFRIMRWSGGAERTFGWEAHEVLGKSPNEFHFVHDEDTTGVDAEADGLYSGASERHLYVNRNYHKDGTVLTCEWYNSVVKDPGGRAISILSQVLDVTEREARRKLDAALGQIAAAANTSLDPEEVLARVLDLGIATLGCDAGLVTLLRRGRWVVSSTLGLPDDVAHTSFDYDAMPAMIAAAETGQPEAHHGDRTDALVDRGTLARLGALSFIVVPLVSQGLTFGGIAFIHRREPRDITDAHMAFVTRLQALVTLALDNARLYQREHRIAETLQDALLTEPERVEGLAIAYVYRPASQAASVGGDFFDAFELEPGRAALLVGDISGKGIEAARLTASVRDGARAFSLEGHAPAAVLERLNMLLTRFSPVESFATVFFGVLDAESGVLEYASGGHPPALLLRPGGVEMLPGHSGIVGAFPGANFESAKVSIDPGDVLVLYTDGIAEARAGLELYGLERLQRSLSAHAETPVHRLPQALVDDALLFAGGSLGDDTIVLCAQVVVASGEGSAEGAEAIENRD